jgi:hypothetical protein
MSKICTVCGKEMKESKNPNKCYSCLCTQEYLVKAGTTPSHKMVKALKHISDMGQGIVDLLTISKNK